MAFSLESTLVVPLCLSLIAASITASARIDQVCEVAAGLEISASLYRHNPQDLYRVVPVSYQGQSSLTLESSPARIIHLTRLIQDDYRYLSQGSLSGIFDRFGLGASE